MALRYDGEDQFGHLKAWRFLDEEDGSVIYEDDPEMARRLGAPVDPFKFTAPDADKFAPAPEPLEDERLAGSRASVRARELENRPEPETAPARTSSRSAVRARELEEREAATEPDEEDEGEDIKPGDLVPVSTQPDYPPQRVIRSPGGMVPQGRTVRTSGPGELLDENGNVLVSAADVLNDLDESYKTREEAIREQGRLEAQRLENEQTQMIKDVAEAETKKIGLEVERDRRQEQDTKAEQKMAGLDEEIRQIKAKPIDDDDWWDRKTTAEKVITVFAALLGGLGSGMRGSATNAGVEMLKRQRKQSVDDQKKQAMANIEHASKQKNRYAQKLKEGRTPEVIEAEIEALEIEKEMQALEENRYLLQKNGVDVDAAIAALQAEKAEVRWKLLQQYKQEVASSEEYRPPSVTVVGGPKKPTEKSVIYRGRVVAEAPSKSTAKKLNDVLLPLGNLDGEAANLENLIQDMEWSDKIKPGSAELERLKSAYNTTVTKIAKALGGVVTAGDLEVSSMQLGGDPTSLVKFKKAALAGLREKRASIRREVDNTVDQTADPYRGQATPATAPKEPFARQEN